MSRDVCVRTAMISSPVFLNNDSTHPWNPCMYLQTYLLVFVSDLNPEGLASIDGGI